tara:strand:+ start:64 stop:441 length:378 start_codon:yes stop_codon:yes gene_type:complete
MSKYNFGKSNRLKSQQKIDQLFVDSNSFTHFPLKVFWRSTETIESSIQIAFGVSKKKLSKAVHRNHIKRLLRESYRQQYKSLESIVSEKGKHLQIMLIFLDTQLWSFQELNNKISVTLKRLKKEL